MTYAVKAIFDTIQGEGARAGMRAVFLRLAGCNLWNGKSIDRDKGKGACARWCDSDFAVGDKMSAGEILAAMDRQWPAGTEQRWCVVTGGEPALQFDGALLEALHTSGWKVAVETNGTIDSDAVCSVDWLTVSPKKGSEVIVRSGSELKVVLPGAVGGEVGWTASELRGLGATGRWEHKFVQPMDPLNTIWYEDTYLHSLVSHGKKASAGRQEEFVAHLNVCIDFVKANPSWRLGIQAHKLWQLP